LRPGIWPREAHDDADAFLEVDDSLALGLPSQVVGELADAKQPAQEVGHGDRVDSRN
jgi:hypothetical protein